MCDLIWLTDAQLVRFEPFLPKSHGEPGFNDRRVLSEIIFIIRNGFRWCNAPTECGPHKTLYNRWKRWSDKGVFIQMMAGLATSHGEKKSKMIDATYLKAHRTATSLVVNIRGRGRLIGRTKIGMNTKLYHICDSQGTPDELVLTAGRVTDYNGAHTLISSLPKVEWLLGERGCDADWFQEALNDKGIHVCIPGRKQWKKPVKYDKRHFKRCNRIEIMFGRLNDRRHVGTLCDRCPNVFLAAISLAALVIFWLLVLTLVL
ncbi:MAG: IS5 family transposase [Rhodobacteraceae bacterium]|nr:IS5 family transposase [Paracoccaceae bacterium]